MGDGAGDRPPGESLLAWSADDYALVPVPLARYPLDVADSWLVDAGRVRGLRLHRERFTDSCRSRHGVPANATAEFLYAACSALPLTGRWFPRVEFEAGAGFRLRLRPAPDPPPGAALRLADEPDRRTHPTVKGPDLERLIAMRHDAARYGADEVLLVSESGTVLEGALSSVLWWRGDVLCAPPADLPILPGVTRWLLLNAAYERGTEVRFETCRPADLNGLELWTASALHGIRPVTSWVGQSLVVAAPRHAADWQRTLAAKAVPVGVEARL